MRIRDFSWPMRFVTLALAVTLTPACDSGGYGPEQNAQVAVLAAGAKVDEASLDFVTRIRTRIEHLIADGTLQRGNGRALQASLDVAVNALERGNIAAAVNQLEALVHKIEALSRSGRLARAVGDELVTMVRAAIDAILNPPPPSLITVVALPTNTSVSGDVPPQGATISLAGVCSAIFPAGAFSSARLVQITTTITDEATSDFNITVALFEMSSRSYEVRINTGDVPPATDVDVRLTVPDQLLDGLPTGWEIQAFVSTDQFSSQELMSAFEAVPSTFDSPGQTVAVTLPGNDLVFSDGNSIAGGHEAVIILAPSPTSTSGALGLTPLAVASTSCPEIGLPLQRCFEIRDGYDPSKGHNGIDIPATTSDNVVAVTDGTVVANDFQIRNCYPNETRCQQLNLTKRGAGHYIILKHDENCYSAYFHLAGDRSNGPKKGTPIRKGQIIGQADSTGGVTGPHLHFEYRTGRYRSQIDPEGSFSLAGVFDGTYTGTSTLPDGFVHSETDVVTGTSATGNHTFTKGSQFGSFAWNATVTPVDPCFATLSGSGTINNVGVRPFVLAGSIRVSADGSATLFWSGTDPMFGPIGWTTHRVP